MNVDSAMSSTSTREPDTGSLMAGLRRYRLALVLVPVVAGAIAAGLTQLIPPTYTAVTVFMPPQQNQSAAASAVASLGALSSLVGGAVNVRTPADQYIALMQSATVADRVIGHFKLMDVYGEKLRVDARLKLSRKVRISLGKKDGLISVEADDLVPQRAADIANYYVEELQRLTSTLALTEAQQRRAFFERQLEQARQKLARAQQVMQASGFNQGALNAEPRSAAEGFARLAAQVASAEVRLQVLRSTLADDTSEVQQQLSTLGALRAQLRKVEAAENSNSGSGPNYIEKYREFKYQETLYELFVRQFELAKLDESREGAVIQVVDQASPPELKSRPKRGAIAIIITLTTGLLLLAWIAIAAAAARARADAAGAAKLDALGSTLRRAFWR